MLVQQRQSMILARVAQGQGATVADLATELAVSQSTIRRDLVQLDRAGKLRRVRGGGAPEIDDQPFEDVATRKADEKDRIGAVAAALVQDRDVVLIDIGTTGASIAKHLRGRNITVATASLAVLDQLRNDRDVELIMLGGVVRSSYLSMVGALTEHALKQLSADIAFIGTSGVRPNGTVLDSTGTEVPIKQAIITNSQRTYLVASSDKFPGSGLLPVCSVKDLDGIITSSPDAAAQAAQAAGATVTITDGSTIENTLTNQPDVALDAKPSGPLLEVVHA